MAPSFPIGDAVTLAELERDPHPVLERLREHEPVSWVTQLGAWLVTRRDLALHVMRAPETYTVDDPRFSTAQVVGPSMLSLDGLEHRRNRDPFARPFRLDAVTSRFTEIVEREVDRLIAGFEGHGSADLRGSLAGPLSVEAMVQALGLEETDPADALAWYAAIVAEVTAITAGAEPDGSGREAFGRLRDSIQPALDRDAASSLVAAAAGEAGGLSREQVASNAAVLLFGGIETTEAMIANAFLHLLSNEDQLDLVSTDRSLLAGAVEESLRLEPAAAVVDRYATGEAELDGVTIGKGDLVTVSLAGANRDPAVFAEPNRFDVRRENVGLQVAFAHGPHVCLGMHLARLETRIAITTRPRPAARAPARPRPLGCPARARLPQARDASGPCGSASVTRVAEALIIDAVRSPIGRRNGTLAGVRADDLAADVLNGLVGRVGIEPATIEDVQMGCVTQIGEQALNVGRIATLVAGWPETVPATTVDRQCGSSMQAAFNAAAAIQAGHLDIVVAAGVESMSRVPMGSNLGVEGFEGLNEKIAARWPIVPQGISAEEIAKEWQLSREQLDAFALESNRRAVAAIDEGRFEREIVPVALGGGESFTVDETPRRDTSAEKLAGLKPAFIEDGRVTAGNSSQIVDGAAAMLIVGEAAAARHGLTPRARFVSFGVAGVDPFRMLHGNPQACAEALRRAGLGWDDMDVIEINEAFASVVLQTLADTGQHARWEAGDVNPNGGGISLGHPLGATGARITATLLAELERRQGRYGLASMCIGQGQAIAAVLERL